MAISTKRLMHDQNIEHSKFLSIYLDQNLRWNRHITHCYSKAKLTSSFYAFNSAKVVFQAALIVM